MVEFIYVAIVVCANELLSPIDTLSFHPKLGFWIGLQFKKPHMEDQMSVRLFI